MVLLRSALRVRPSLPACFPAPITARHLHLQPHDVPHFLAKTGIAGLDTAVQSPTSISSDAAKRSLAVLIHTDRTPQSWPGSTKAQTGAFFGPSILAARSRDLSSVLDGTDLDRQKTFGQGGLGLLKLQKEKPDLVRQISLFSQHLDGFGPDEAESFAASLTDSGQKQLGELLRGLWKVFDEYEGLWFSFRLSQEGNNFRILEPFLEFDPFAVGRQPLLQPYHASRPLDENTLLAEKGGLFYIKLSSTSSGAPPGNVGCFGYGAGNAMATMDGLNLAGGRPANFLDGGGGANRQNAKLAIETLNRDENVKSIFVNTFGGITRTDIVAQGIIDAVKENNITKPIVTRMKGTGSEEAARVLKDSGLSFAFYDDFRAAAAHAVRAARDGKL